VGNRSSLADDFHEGAFAAAAVEFAVEDLFPRAEIEFAFGNGDDDFAAHDLALEMGVGVIFAGAIVTVGGGGRVMKTDAVMCMALTRHRPSRTPLWLTSSSIFGVMLMNPRRPGISNQRYSVSDFTG